MLTRPFGTWCLRVGILKSASLACRVGGTFVRDARVKMRISPSSRRATTALKLATALTDVQTWMIRLYDRICSHHD